LVDGSLAHIPDGGGLDNVTDSEPLDGLVLGAGTGAVGAADEGHVATAVL